MDNIHKVLLKLFDRHRIIFWYDRNREFTEAFENLQLPGVEKIMVENSQYTVKYRVLREEPDQKFLLFFNGPQPEDEHNWLLDVQLANGTFSADRISMWAAELGLRPEHIPLIKEHSGFFEADSRRAALKARLEADDSHAAIRMKILAVAAENNADARLESVLEVLLGELAAGEDQKYTAIERFGLDAFLWERVRTFFAYSSTSPTMKDFMLTLFKSCYAVAMGEQAHLTQDAVVFLKRWKDSRTHQAAFETLSGQVAEILAIKADIQDRDLGQLVDADYFSLIDLKILSELARQVSSRTITAGECARVIWNRRTTHWFQRYADVYEAINFGSQCLAAIDQADLAIHSLADGMRKYQETWYRIDQLYRKFILHHRASKQTTLLQDLYKQVEKFYSNRYLLSLNDNWQHAMDAGSAWDASPIVRQPDFFPRHVQPFLEANTKVAVVISDALRYEIGEELAEMIKGENRFDADLALMLGMLPSYTQLGMAALLPHAQLRIDENSTVFVDGQSSAGIPNREKILRGAVPASRALGATDLQAMNHDTYRALFREHDLVFIYHNLIDAIGDDALSEERVFEAARDSLGELISIIKKLTNANFTNILITSDHGFIYQHEAIDESEFAGNKVEGSAVWKKNRRFVVGMDLKPSPSVQLFAPKDLGLQGDYQVAIPRSINRLRLSGAGSRFVHGGASLQEVAIPVVTVRKKRESDVSTVDVDIIASSSNVITSGQISIAFYQKEPVSAKLQPRTLRAGIYAQDGSLISNREELPFNFTAQNARERQVPVRFVLSRKADEANNQTVTLKLEERVPGTTHYTIYKSMAYQLRRSFTTDFDF